MFNGQAYGAGASAQLPPVPSGPVNLPPPGHGNAPGAAAAGPGQFSQVPAQYAPPPATNGQYNPANRCVYLQYMFMFMSRVLKFFTSTSLASRMDLLIVN